MSLKVAAALLWFAPCVVMAHPLVDQGKDAFARGEFKLALLRLERAARAPDKTEDETVEMHWYRAATLQRLGRNKAAATAFDALLRIRPLYEPDKYDAPPDLRAAFNKHAAGYLELHGVQLGQARVAQGGLRVEVTRFAEQVAEVAAFVRIKGGSSYAAYRLAMTQTEAAVPTAWGTISDEAFWRALAQGGEVEVALEARSARGTPLARRGDAMEPVTLQVDASVAQVELAARAHPPPPVSETAPAVEAPPASPADSVPSPVQSPQAIPQVQTPTEPASTGGVSAATVGGALASVPAGVLLAMGGVSAVAAVATWVVFGGALYAVSSVKGIQVNPQYGVVTAVYQWSFWPAVLLTGFGAMAIGLGSVAGALAAALLIVAQLV